MHAGAGSSPASLGEAGGKDALPWLTITLGGRAAAQGEGAPPPTIAVSSPIAILFSKLAGGGSNPLQWSPASTTRCACRQQRAAGATP